MKELMIKTGEYEKNGQVKGEWTKVGFMKEGANGPYIMLDPTIDLAGCLLKQRLLNPQKAGKSVLVSLFDKQEQTPKTYGEYSSSTQQKPFDDTADVPF